MAEIKNSFLKSKMNKDLDDRLVPNGEYRDAMNISVGKSEDDDIGALENVLGNSLVPQNISISSLGVMHVVGYLTDNNTQSIYLFLVSATDPTENYIYLFFNNEFTRLVEGAFLNFNKDNQISGINLVENLLFWTDNLNQPRKINVTATRPVIDPSTGVTTTPGYYTKENQLSVAKYNPFQPLTLLKKTTSVAGATSAAKTITISVANTSIIKGMSVIGPSILASEYIYVTDVSGTTVTVNANASVTNGDTLTFITTTMTGNDITYNFNNGVEWPGDPDFLQDLFVRFSYRYKFDDNEYSIMAPFSQPTFIPKQKGYFISGDEDAAYRSTILAFMENGVQNIELIIPLPDRQKNCGSQTDDTYKITEIDILYKESDARTVKVLDSVNVNELNSNDLNSYTYNYQSRKPYKTLPERQTVRVYDKVPVRALSQEVTGNRVMYGNYQSQHTPPASLDYNVGANAKNTTVFENWIEYPSSTLKQNRNYQVGFVLSDKWGRQSSVLLSSVDATGQTVGGTFFGGSTFYHPYRASGQNLDQWFGDALKVVINSAVESTKDLLTGTPGLYAVPIDGIGFNIAGNQPTFGTNNNPLTEYSFSLNGVTSLAGAEGVPTFGSYLRGQYKDFVKVLTAGGGIQTGVTSQNNQGGIRVKLTQLNYGIVKGMKASGYTGVQNLNVDAVSYVGEPASGGTPAYAMYADLSAMVSYSQGDTITFSNITETTSSDNQALTSSAALVLGTANADIKVGMTVTGGGLPADTVISSITSTTEFTLSKDVTLAINQTLTYTIWNYVVTTDDAINEDLYSLLVPSTSPDTKFAYNLPNPLGWYSYKLVVKQQEQDYYNCYLPGFLNAYPSTAGVTDPPVFPTTETDLTANVVLLNDNINKVPRDLNETSDQQRQFRSSVQLYGRVNNNSQSTNIQYFPVTTGIQTLPLSMTADTIATASDLAMSTTDISTTNVPFYQLDTNPFIARLATLNSGTTVIGTTTANNMAPILSVAETEPVESLLQLFYETSTAGLIADLNADINTGFDGVAALSALSYSQNENMAANQDVTAVFYPQNNQGSNFTNTQIQNVIMTVVDAAGIQRATGNINLTANLSNGFTGDFKLITSGTGYKIQTAVDTFVYSAAGFDSNGNSKEVYTFNFTWTTISGSGGDTSSNSATGALSNLDPEFTAGATLPDVTITTTLGTGVSNPVATRDGNNGSKTDSTLQLKYSIVASSDPNSYFQINQSGIVSKAIAGIPLGVYNITLKIQDAVINNVLQSDSKFIEKTQKITVGAEPINSGAASGCKHTGVPNMAATGQITAPQNSPVTGVWYVAASSLAAADLPVTPSANTGSSNFLHRLGTAALTKGTIVFSCNMQQRFSNTGGGMSFVTSGGQWKIWRRADASSSWNIIDDVNNFNMQAPGQPVSVLNNSFNSIRYEQTVFAFDQAGEYAVALINAETTQAATTDDNMVAFVNSNDLYYSTCVTENGSDVTDGNTPKRYQYDLSGSTTSYNCATGNTTRYAPMPYAQYVDIFYTNSTLTNPWTVSTPEFYSFKTSTAVSEPFTDIRVSAKFGTDGIKMSAGVISDPCSDQYARVCPSAGGGGSGSCGNPIIGD